LDRVEVMKEIEVGFNHIRNYYFFIFLMYILKAELEKSAPSIENISILNRHLSGSEFFTSIPARLQKPILLLEEFHRRVPESVKAVERCDTLLEVFDKHSQNHINTIIKLQNTVLSKKSSDSILLVVNVSYLLFYIFWYTFCESSR